MSSVTAHANRSFNERMFSEPHALLPRRTVNPHRLHYCTTAATMMTITTTTTTDHLICSSTVHLFENSCFTRLAILHEIHTREMQSASSLSTHYKRRLGTTRNLHVAFHLRLFLILLNDCRAGVTTNTMIAICPPRCFPLLLLPQVPRTFFAPQLRCREDAV